MPNQQKMNKNFLDSFITLKPIKLVSNISNQFNHQYYLILFLIMSEILKYIK